MSADEREHLFESVGKALPVGRVGEPYDIAQAYLFLMQEGFGPARPLWSMAVPSWFSATWITAWPKVSHLSLTTADVVGRGEQSGQDLRHHVPSPQVSAYPDISIRCSAGLRTLPRIAHGPGAHFHENTLNPIMERTIQNTYYLSIEIRARRELIGDQRTIPGMRYHVYVSILEITIKDARTTQQTR